MTIDNNKKKIKKKCHSEPAHYFYFFILLGLFDRDLPLKIGEDKIHAGEKHILCHSRRAIATDTHNTCINSHFVFRFSSEMACYASMYR